jgi:hypothetical protein
MEGVNADTGAGGYADNATLDRSVSNYADDPKP